MNYLRLRYVCIYILVNCIILQVILFCSSMASKVPIESEIFTKNYSNFCDILKNEDSLLPKLVDKSIISFDDIDEIKSKPAGEKGPTLLKHISGPLKAGHTTGFYGLLGVMETNGKPDTQKFARKIKKECSRNNYGTYVSQYHVATYIRSL